MKSALLGLVCLLFSSKSFAIDQGAPFINLRRISEELNILPYFKSNPEQKIKIAILDNGFRLAKEEIGKSLPANTILHAPKLPLDGEEEDHGFYMARLLWSLLSQNGKFDQFAPSELHLYTTFGFTNFKAAVEDAIQQKVDIILYAQTWEYGGNFDGKGFINSVVDTALDAGIIWVNSSGNFGRTTYNTTIKDGVDHWISLPGKNQSVEIRCEKNPKGTCPLRAVLSWNSFADNTEIGTDKDLDFFLTDDTLDIIKSSNLVQTVNPPSNQTGYTKYPREIITAELKPGLYFLRAKNRSLNFSSADRMRITASGDFITMKNPSMDETLLPPADNARVITVGSLDSDKTSMSKTFRKPELWTNSLVQLSSKDSYLGTSNSAAMVAAGIAVLKSLKPELDRDAILRLLKNRSEHNGGNGLPLEDLGFSFTGENCFAPSELDEYQLPPHVLHAINFGGTLVETTAGLKILFPFDPIRLLPGYSRNYPNDILAYGPGGAGLFPRSALWNLPAGIIELLEFPSEQTICGQSQNRLKIGQAFRLPMPANDLLFKSFIAR